MRCTSKKRINDELVIAQCEIPDTKDNVETYFVLDRQVQPKAALVLENRRQGLVVTAISVKERKDQHKRLGTRLYEFAAELACKRGKPLVSDTERSQFAEAFWRKQTAKGRAGCVEAGGAVFYANPTVHLTPQERAKLPQPDGDFWPCKRYGVTKPCAVTSLEGMKRRRRKR